jgi:phospholipase/carboxylesterase
MSQRLVLLHGWGADADDLRPLGDALMQLHHAPLEVVSLQAPEPHPQGSGRQWYGLFPAAWEAVPQAVADLRERLVKLSGGEEALTKTVLFGFSQGGAMALHCGCDLPLAGVMSCSGYPHPDWQPASNHPPVLLAHGTEDTIVPVAAMGAIWSRLQTDRCEKLEFNQGHTIPLELMGTFQQTLSRMLPAEIC